MLSHLRIRNFKAWQDTGPVQLAPLTVIFGANSSGKSSLGHLLLALQQTARSSDRRRALHLGNADSLVDLGTFLDCLHGHDASRQLEFELGWQLPQAMALLDPLAPRQMYEGNALHLAVALAAGAWQQPELRSLSYRLQQDGNDVLDVLLQRQEGSEFALTSEHYKFAFHQGKEGSLEPPEKFYRLADACLARLKNAGFMADFALATESLLDRLAYVGPLRKQPQRIYSWSGETPENVGTEGEFTVPALLAAQHQGRVLSTLPGTAEQPFAQVLAGWLQRLGIIHDFSVQALAAGRKEYEVLVRTHPAAPPVPLTDVGFGVSQVLPVLVQAFYAAPQSTVWIEQPEVHLHAQVQAELADACIAAVQACENGQPRQVQLIIESHSEHFLNRLQRRIAEGGIAASEVAVYFCRRTGAATELDPLRLNEFGEIENWPENFFGDEMADIAGRTLAAMQRRKAVDGKG